MSLWTLALLIALYNLMTFGNGPVMIPLLQTHLVGGAFSRRLGTSVFQAVL